MPIITAEQARAAQKTPDDHDHDNDNICILTETIKGRTARCIVAASIYAIWPGGNHRPGHTSGCLDGWGDGYNSRQAFINAHVFLRSILGFATSEDEISVWNDRMNKNANFQVKTHFKSLAGKNNSEKGGNFKYQADRRWLITDESGWIKATEKGIAVYKKAHEENHGSDWKFIEELP